MESEPILILLLNAVLTAGVVWGVLKTKLRYMERDIGINKTSVERVTDKIDILTHRVDMYLGRRSSDQDRVAP